MNQINLEITFQLEIKYGIFFELLYVLITIF
jgi:hypothetical protein